MMMDDFLPLPHLPKPPLPVMSDRWMVEVIEAIGRTKYPEDAAEDLGIDVADLDAVVTEARAWSIGYTQRQLADIPDDY